jgi:hypothetical protein
MNQVFARYAGAMFAVGITLGVSTSTLGAQTAPSTYSAYTGTDAKTIPMAPSLGPANSVINDPTFGSRILRVTDPNTNGGESFISTDAGSHRAWNANSTAIKLTGPHGDGYWLEFSPSTFTIGNGSSPAIHSLPFGATWEWSAIDPNVIYFLNGNQIGKYNTSTGVATNLGGPPNGDPVTYMAVVIGQDNWVCAAAGPGSQNSYTEIYCVNPISPGTSKFIDVYHKTINGIPQSDPNWPTSAAGQTIGIHDISGGTGAAWLEVTFHQQSWGANGGAVLNLGTNTWSLLTNADPYWSGHVSMGNGKYINSSGSVNGLDSRGMVQRDPNNLMNSTSYQFVYQPPNTLNGWCDAEHNSWFNSLSNSSAPVLVSRYGGGNGCPYAWTGEIDAAAVDGSNTVWRFAHNHNGASVCYYAQSFAQISNDGHWAVFSSYWDGTLGPDTAFGCTTRIDTFIIDLSGATGNAVSGTTSGTSTTGTTTTPPPGTTVRIEQTDVSVTYSGTWYSNSNAVMSGGSAALAMDAGSRATFTFNGVGASWVAYRDEWSGLANIYVDGVLKTQIDTYASPSISQSKPYSITGLGAGTHTLTIEAAGTHDSASSGSWVWIDAFEYTTASTTSSTTSSSGSTTPPTLTSTVIRLEETDASVSYSGSWYSVSNTVLSGGTSREAMDKNSSVTFTFNGTGASWIGYEDPWSGIAKVYVDGTMANNKLDTYSGSAKAQQKAYTVTGLAPGKHTIKIVVTGTHDSTSKGAWVWVDAFEFTTAP